MLGNYDYLENLDYLQLYYPLFSEGYALAFAEYVHHFPAVCFCNTLTRYTQTFVLQYYGTFHGGTGTSGAQSTACNIVPGSAADISVSACQLTFTQTLKSVFPLVDTSVGSNPNRLSKVDSGNLSGSNVFEYLVVAWPHITALADTLPPAGVATQLRASVFHPTRTGGTAATPSNNTTFAY
jgi:hypothetical protein